MDYSDRFKVGVFGSADGDLESLRNQAQVIGREIAAHNGILVTGACPGLPYEAAKGADEKKGLVLGFSPAINLHDHIYSFHFPVNPHILIFTGQGKKGRNITSVRSCDAAIFISGRTGTMNEFTIFWDEATPKGVVGFLVGSGGVVDCEIPSLVAKLTQEKPSAAHQIWELHPVDLIRKVFEKLSELRNSP